MLSLLCSIIILVILLPQSIIKRKLSEDKPTLYFPFLNFLLLYLLLIYFSLVSGAIAFFAVFFGSKLRVDTCTVHFEYSSAVHSSGFGLRGHCRLQEAE